jgi:D-arginine dehydrogenase
MVADVVSLRPHGYERSSTAGDPMEQADIIIIGGGIAGASAGFALAPQRRVVLLERESQPGYHSTGRSAALFTEAYGNATIRGLTRASRAFFLGPPQGFTDHPLLTPRGVITIGRADQKDAVEKGLAEAHRHVKSVRRLTPEEACARLPMMRRDYVAHAFTEPEAMDIDVHAVHRGYLRGMTAAGGRVVTDAEVLALGRKGADWQVETKAGVFSAPVVVNAAGAWCDEIGKLAGLAPIGLVPKRRTAITFDLPAGQDPSPWPSMIDASEQFYFKPDAGRILASPADETPMPPCDVQPDELDIAILVDRLEQATTFQVKRIAAKWAGLRSFVFDKTLVAGFDAAAPGFFWVAGQGGYGIQTSPTMGRVAAALVTGKGLPADIAGFGVTDAALAPGRCRA